MCKASLSRDVACRVSGCRLHSNYLTNSSINIENRIQCKQGDAARHISTKDTKYPEYFTLIFHRNTLIPSV